MKIVSSRAIRVSGHCPLCESNNIAEQRNCYRYFDEFKQPILLHEQYNWCMDCKNKWNVSNLCDDPIDLEIIF
jgi:hypothetical protein